MNISIIIPAYNAESFLAYTLSSVTGQTYTDWELIIIDDGSTDRTAVIAQEYADRDSRIRLVTQDNGGVAAARNRGLAEISASSEYVAFLDHDDLWRQDILALLLQALKEHPDAVGAHGLALAVDGADHVNDLFIAEGVAAQRFRRKIVRHFGFIHVMNCDLSEPTTFHVQVYDGPISTPGQMLARRNAVERVGVFDSSTTPCDDWDFWARLSLLGPIMFVNEIVLNWRSHGGNASGSKGFMGHGVSQIRRKMFHYPGATPEQQALAHWRYRKMYASVERHNAQDSLRWAWKSLQRGRCNAFAHELTIGLSLYIRYVGLCWFWGKKRDRGPLPRRLSDSRTEPLSPLLKA